MRFLTRKQSATYTASRVKVDLGDIPIEVWVSVDDKLHSRQVVVESSVGFSLRRAFGVKVVDGTLLIWAIRQNRDGGAVIASGAGAVAVRGNVTGSISTGSNSQVSNPDFPPFNERGPHVIHQVGGASSKITLRVAPDVLNAS